MNLLLFLPGHRDRMVGEEELLGVLWLDAVVCDGSLRRIVSLARSIA